MSATIQIIITGGSLSMRQSGNAAIGMMPVPDNQIFVERLARLAKDADVVQLMNIDSANIGPRHWRTIAETIARGYGNYSGFVVVHGTDSLPYTAAALAYSLLNLKKPVVMVGSQVPLIGDELSDGHMNLFHAIQVAHLNIPEVVIVSNGKLYRGTRSYKYSNSSFDIYATIDPTPLAEIGVHLVQFAPYRPVASAPLSVAAEFDQHVQWQVVMPGLKPTFLDVIIDSGIHGLFLQCLGNGSVCNEGELSMVPSITRAIAKGVAVVVGSQCRNGFVHDKYAVSALRSGAISAQDMTAEAAVVKLMWALGQTHDLEQIRAVMQTNYAHEIGCYSVIRSPEEEISWN